MLNACILKCTLIFFLVAVLTVTGQTKINSDSLLREIKLHFKIFPPEAQRYSGLTTYGDTKVIFTKEQITKEPLLIEAVKKSELIHHPTIDILDLCHNISIHSPPTSIPAIKKIIERTTDDETQTKAIFAYLEKIKSIGEKSSQELKASMDWIKKETNAANKYGVIVESDVNFISRFGDIHTPAMVWLEKEGLLDTAKALHPIPFTAAKKNELLKLLIESKGFGLEAVKGQLFLSLEQSDIPTLLELRKSCVYSPNTFSFGRLSTIGMFIRYLRKTKK